MKDGPVYSLGDAVEVCLDDSWAIWRFENCRNKSEAFARQQLVRQVDVKVLMPTKNRATIRVTFDCYIDGQDDCYWWPLDRCGEDLYTIPLYNDQTV